jgi:hypothetical protein
MNKTNIKQHVRRTFSALAIIGLLAVGALFAVPKAQAGYGRGALYQIELSASNSITPPMLPRAGGGGIWLWIALYDDPNHPGDYSGSDCVHGLPPDNPDYGAAADNGDVTSWETSSGTIYDCNNNVVYSGPTIVIHGVVLNGFPAPYETTITVPRPYGHYTGNLGTFLTLPLPLELSCAGRSMSVLEVAR